MHDKLILVVEDETDLAELLRELLELGGMRVVVAPHGRAALAALDEIEPDLVLTDLMLPVMDGLEFLKRYAERPGPRARIVAMSAIGPYLEEARKLGASAVLYKPFELDALYATLTSVLEGKAPKPQPTVSRDETERLRAVFDLKLTQPSAEDALGEFTEWVARVFELPVCLVSIVTDEEQVWTAQCGLPPELATRARGAREESFCTHAVTSRSALIVQDAASNPFFRDNVFVTQWGVRFYAGIPLLTRKGQPVGTLCVMDFEARRFTYFDLELLGLLARRVMHELDWRDRQANPGEPESAFRYLSWVDAELDIFGREALTEALRILSCRSVERQEQLSAAVIAVDDEPLDKAVGKLMTAFPRGFIGRLGKTHLAVVVPSASPEVLKFQLERHGHDRWRVAVHPVRTPFGVEALLGHLERTVEARD